MQPRETSPRIRLVLIVAVALAARAVTFGNPVLHNDEQFYFTVAARWAQGLWPYVDVWDRKPIGLFLLYLPAARLGYPAGIWAYQALALASVVATAWIIARIADRVGWERGATAGALAYVLWLDLLEGQGGQAPAFYNLPMAAAALLILPRAGAGRWRAPAGMALVGLALQIKYSAVFEGAYFGLVLLNRAWREGARARLVPYAALLGALALLPTAMAWAIYAARGEGAAWLFANVTSIFARGRDPLIEQVGNLALIVVVTAPLVVLAGVAWGRRADDAAQRFVFGWLAVAGAGLLAFGTWFDHYALPLLVPACIVASGAIASRAKPWRLALPLLLVAAVVGQGMLALKRYQRGTPAEFAALAAAVGRGPGCLYVYAGDPVLYAATGRCGVTRYLFPSHLTRLREARAIGVDPRAETARIIAAAPAVIVVAPPFRGEDPAARAQIGVATARLYRVAAKLPMGTKTVTVFTRR